MNNDRDQDQQGGWAGRNEFIFEANGTITLPAPLDASTLKSWDPAGDIMLFRATSAPTAWTKVTTWNNRALRLINGSITTGGSNGFTTVFGSSKSTDGHAITLAESAPHRHLTVHNESSSNSRTLTSGRVMKRKFNSNTDDEYDLQASANDTDEPDISKTDEVGGGAAHSHTIGNFDLQYVDVILATKDA